MAIRVVFPVGQATYTVKSGLYQWDYGQILEIESADLLPIVEVHFACSGMTEAIVRPCSVNNGLATVPIPDICLEQAGPISAWVFEINGTEGMTRKMITIPVVGRLKPAPGDTIPTEVYDKYTELITELNEAIKALTEGKVTAAQAKNANYAAEAGHANSASSANTAINASYSSRAGRLSIDQKTQKKISATGLYLVKWKNAKGLTLTEFLLIDSLMGSDIYSSSSVTDDASMATSALMYSTYDGAIKAVNGTIYDVYHIADHSIPLG